MAIRSSLSPPAVPREPLRGRPFARLAEHVRTLVPQAVAVGLVTDDGASSWFADPELSAAASALGPLGERGRLLLGTLLGRDRPLLLRRIDDWEAAPELLALAVELLGPERARAAWRALKGSAAIACPLRPEPGRATGVLVVVTPDALNAIGLDEARTLELLSDLAAIALEPAGRGAAEPGMQRAVEAISASLEPEAVYREVVSQAGELTGATKVLLTRLDDHAGELNVVAGFGFSAALQDGQLGLDSGGFGHAARTRRPILGELDEELMRREGVGSLMHAPVAQGAQVYGVLTVGHRDAGRFAARDLELLARLAGSSASAIANSIDFESERRVARALTLGFVPESLPEVPGYEAGLLYLPADGGATGGDVYGAWHLEGGDLAVLIGDVAGKGVEKAALSSMVRFFIEARSWDEPSPAAVLEQANAMLGDRLPADSFVTVFLGVLSANELRYCNAGHLPPLLLSGSRAHELASHGLALGIEADARYSEQRIELQAGDLVFAYTDGLIEARRDGETFGAERLSAAVGAAATRLAPAELVKAVHEEIAQWADGLTDDVAALALRRAAPAARSA